MSNEKGERTIIDRTRRLQIAAGLCAITGGLIFAEVEAVFPSLLVLTLLFWNMTADRTVTESHAGKCARKAIFIFSALMASVSLIVSLFLESIAARYGFDSLFDGDFVRVAINDVHEGCYFAVFVLTLQMVTTIIYTKKKPGLGGDSGKKLLPRSAVFAVGVLLISATVILGIFGIDQLFSSSIIITLLFWLDTSNIEADRSASGKSALFTLNAVTVLFSILSIIASYFLLPVSRTFGWDTLFDGDFVRVTINDFHETNFIIFFILVVYASEKFFSRDKDLLPKKDKSPL